MGTERERGWRRTKKRKMGTRTGTGVETRGRTQDENGGRSGDGDEDENEDGIGEGGRKARKRKKPRKSCRLDVGNGGDLVGVERKKRRHERVGSVAANPDNLELEERGKNVDKKGLVQKLPTQII